LLYPLSYGGPGGSEHYQPCADVPVRAGGAGRTLAGVSTPLGRVLVVDDSDVIRQLIQVNLELEGFEVVTAADGQECLDVVSAVRPDVVTLDVVMPRLDGWKTSRRLREGSDTAGIKIAMVTACAQESDFRKGREVGVDAYLTKPFDPVELVRTVRELAGAPAV
jgi:DNA-binding response OmpR family regulator